MRVPVAVCAHERRCGRGRWCWSSGRVGCWSDAREPSFNGGGQACDLDPQVGAGQCQRDQRACASFGRDLGGQRGRIVLLVLKPAVYRIGSPNVVVGARLYGAASTERTARVRKGLMTTVAIRYAAVSSSSSLTVSGITQSSISFTWSAPKGARFALRRTSGTVPAAAPTEGTAVPVRATTAADPGLSPGSVYAYALFTRVRGRWTGPLTTFASTASRDGARTATYVADPSTFIPAPGEVAGVNGTGSGLDVMLKPGVLPPVLGAAMVLPASTALPGGYIGTVTAISADGSVVSLAPATLSDAFDYYNIDVPNIAASTAALAHDAPHRSPYFKSAVEPGCGGGISDDTVGTAPISFGGHYLATYSKYKILGVNVTTGASLDVAITASINPDVSVSTGIALNCALTLASVTKIIAEIPLGPAGILPILAKGDLGITLSSSGAFAATNLGGSATGEFSFKGSFNGPASVPLTGALTGSFTPLDTTFTTTATFSLKAGIQLTVGPGVGNKNAGVVAGISGEFDPVNASYALITDSSEDPSQPKQQCVKLDAAVTSGLSLSAQAWLGSYSVSRSLTAPWLNSSSPIAGGPWYIPQNCEFEITSTSALPQATQGSAYIASLQATGGTTPYTWAVTTGSLPAGLTLDPATGVITGTPTTAGTSTFQITVTDADRATATKSFILTVGGGDLEVTTDTLGAAWIGTPYSNTLEAAGGTPPYTWQITGGSLPSGLTLDPSTGVISGTLPSSATCLGCDTTDQLTVQVTDANGQTAVSAVPSAGSAIPLLVAGTPPPCTSGCSLVAALSGGNVMVTSPSYVPTQCWVPIPGSTYPDGNPYGYDDYCSLEAVVLDSDGSYSSSEYGWAGFGEFSAQDGQDPSTFDVPFGLAEPDCAVPDYYAGNTSCAGDKTWLSLWFSPDGSYTDATLLAISNELTLPGS